MAISIRQQISSEDAIKERLQSAIKENNAEALADLLRFAPDFCRTLALNKRTYEAACLCGYQPEITFDRNGWLKEKDLEKKCETITYDGKAFSVKILLLQHPNGKWVKGYDVSFPSYGTSSLPSVFDDQYDTRMEALKAGMDSLIEYIGHHQDDKNSRDAITRLKKERMNLSQLSLFV